MSRTLLPIAMLAALASTDDAPPTENPPLQVTDGELDALLAIPESSRTTEDTARIMIGTVERELARAQHYDPRTGVRLYTVEDVLTCLREHGSVDVQAPAPAMVVDDAHSSAPPLTHTAASSQAISHEVVSEALSARDGRCCVEGCSGRAEYAPVIILRALRRRDEHRLEIPAGLCAHHKITRVSDVLSDQVWASDVCAPLERVGFRPAKHLCEIRHVPLFEA